jgi:hypothetical protein
VKGRYSHGGQGHVRKLAWGLAVCGLFVMGATLWSSNYAARHPESLLGKVMHGASHVASQLTPATGFGPVLAAMQKKPTPHDEVDGIPAEPEPVDAAPGGEAKFEAEQDAVATAAPIVIPEEEGVALETKPAIRPVQHEAPFGPETECPEPAVCRAPAVMPFCHDEEACEVLPMPTVEKVEEEQEAGLECVKPGHDEMGHPLIRMFLEGVNAYYAEKSAPPADEAGNPATKADECREDPHHHHHHSSCPYTGRSYCPVSKPSCEPIKPAGSEEPNEGAKGDDSSSKTALKKMKRFKTRESIEEGGCPTYPTYPSVDTMEMRPSDRQLYDYGPGVL